MNYGKLAECPGFTVVNEYVLENIRSLSKAGLKQLEGKEFARFVVNEREAVAVVRGGKIVPHAVRDSMLAAE
jgi:hypothetical protein